MKYFGSLHSACNQIENISCKMFNAESMVFGFTLPSRFAILSISTVLS